MPTLVHITNDDERGSIQRSGIRIGKYRDGVYAMPVLANFVVSNQWLREVKRETVYMGHHSREHVEVTCPASLSPGTYKSRIFRQRFYDRS